MNRTELEIREHNSRLGLSMFSVYLCLYLGFVLINAFRADWMEAIVLAGLNLAVVYGFGLIVAALVLALIYGMLCRREPIRPTSDPASRVDVEPADSAPPGEQA